MSTTLTNPQFYTTQYGANWEHLVQQQDSRLMEYCRLVTVRGKERTFNQIGKAAMVQITGRTEETVAVPGDYRKRWVRTLPYHDVRWFDEFDATFYGEVTEPDSDTVKSQAMAVARQCDQVGLDAFFGTNYEGELGTTAQAFATANVIANAGTNLNTAKLITAREKLSAAEAFSEGNADDALICVITANQVSALMNDLLFQNADHNTQRGLVEGQPTTWLGFKFIRTELLPKAANIRSCLAYVKSGAVLAKGDQTVDICRRKDRNNAIQVRTTVLLGATRIEEDKFVQIDCDETA